MAIASRPLPGRDVQGIVNHEESSRLDANSTVLHHQPWRTPWLLAIASSDEEEKPVDDRSRQTRVVQLLTAGGYLTLAVVGVVLDRPHSPTGPSNEFLADILVVHVLVLGLLLALAIHPAAVAGVGHGFCNGTVGSVSPVVRSPGCCALPVGRYGCGHGCCRSWGPPAT